MPRFGTDKVTQVLAAGLRWLFTAQGELKEQALRGTIWLVLAEAATRLAGVAKVAVLGRLLSPRDFGLLGVALLIQQWIGSITQTGISSTLVQKKGDVREYLDTAWTISLIRGTAVFAIIYGLAPWGASYFRTPEAVPVIRSIALLTLPWELVNPAVVQLRRELDFRKDVAWRLSGVLPGLVTGVVLAIILRNVWALVGSLIASRSVEVLASYRIRPERPRLEFDRLKARELMRTGKWFSWMNVAGFLEYQLDSLFTARWLGARALGYYQVAAQVALLPTAGLGSQVAAVLFPAFARLKDGERLRRTFLASVGALALTIAPLACALSLYADTLVRLALGPQWAPIATTLAWLAWAGLARSLGGAGTSLFQATGRLKTAMAFQLLRVLVLAALLWALVPRFGFLGTAMAVTLAALLVMAPQLALAARLLGVRSGDMLSALAGGILAAAPLLLLGLAVIPLSLSWRLAALALAGACSLAIVLWQLRSRFGLNLEMLRVSEPVASRE
ncbi:MAG: lipopolysaccharide biosynthesis protein [Bryobacteraceae bacterium]